MDKDKATKGTPLAGSARLRHPESKYVSTAPETMLLPVILLVRYSPDAPPMLSLDAWANTAPQARKILSPVEYAHTYGATKEDVAAVLSFAAQNGMTVLRADAATRSITVNCPVTSAKSAFAVQLNRYESPDPMAKGAATYTHFGFDGEVHLPPTVAGIITAVIGLDNRKIYSGPADFTGDPSPASPLLVSEVAQLYKFPKLPAAIASDVVIGLHAPGNGYLQTDIDTYFSNAPAGFQTPPVMHDANCVVGGKTYTNSNIVDAEISLDIQTSTTIAQGCTANVYHTEDTEQGWVVFMNRVLVPPPGEKQPQVLTTSYPLDRGEVSVGNPNTPGSQSAVMTTLFQALASQGINVFASSGDYGSLDLQTDSKAHVQYPASDPWVTAVGGTVIGNTKTGPSGTFSDGTFDEYVWSDVGNNASNFFSSSAPTGFGATGGGVSALFDRPSYQSSLVVKDSTGKIVNGRAIPDIAGMIGCHGYVIGGAADNTLLGTSITTPMYAGLFAVLQATMGRSFGPLNPLLYNIGKAFPQAYKDIVVGDNDSGPGVPFYTSAVGWDAASGWGSVNGTNLQNGLAQALYSKNFYITVRKNSFGLDEVSGAISAAGSGSTTYDAFWLVLEGYTPNQLPKVAPVVASALFSAGSVTVDVGIPILELQSAPDTPQRILYPCTITFFTAAAHASNDPVNPGVFPPVGSSPNARTIVAGINVDGGIEADGEIELTPGADPYFSNVALNPNGTGANYWFLSQDLRVFTTTPGALTAGQRPMNDNSSPTFPAVSGTTRSANAGYSYIQSLLAYLNNAYTNPNGTDPFTLLPGQNNALNSDSSVAPTANGLVNYGYGIARVRISGPSTKPVKVYFRLFVSNSPDTDFNPNTTYPTLNGSPTVGVGVTTIPMFATGNYDKNQDFNANIDYSQPSSNNFSINGAGDHWAYFGCYLNIYPADNTIPVNGGNVSISSQLPGTHHCLVAQIDFPDAAITTINGMNASPENSDKLAQRNLQVTMSDNPGPADTHRIPQTFDIRPSPQPSDVDPLKYLPDELRIDWGNTPAGSVASIYWPQVNIADIVALAKQLYATNQLSASPSEADTLVCTVPAGGFTYVPIPVGSRDNFASLFTIQLPQGVVRGQEFLLTVDRISSRQPPEIISVVPAITVVKKGRRIPQTTNWRYVTGTFAVRIPVSTPSEILPSELDTLAILSWRLNQLSPTNRWYPVLQRYLSYINDRVIGLGYTGPVEPSPEGFPPGLLPCTPPPPPQQHPCCCEKCLGERRQGCDDCNCTSSSKQPSPECHHHYHHHHYRYHQCCDYPVPKEKEKSSCSEPDHHPHHHPSYANDRGMAPIGPFRKFTGTIKALTYDCNGIFDGFILLTGDGCEEEFRGVDRCLERLLACGSQYEAFAGDDLCFEISCPKQDRSVIAVSVERSSRFRFQRSAAAESSEEAVVIADPGSTER